MSVLNDLLEEILKQKPPAVQQSQSNLKQLLDTKLKEKYTAPIVETKTVGNTVLPGYSQRELDLARAALPGAKSNVIAEPVTEPQEDPKQMAERLRRERMTPDQLWLEDNYFPQEFLPLLKPV